MGGFPAALRDTRDYYEHDIRFIIVVTLVVVLLILMALLRAIVAPLYLIGSVIISYFAALGISVLTFQYLLGQQLHWSVPPLAFVVLVAVGADYNLLLVSRMRDESPHGMRYGIIRTLTSTGGVITAAGLIFAASMCGLLFSSITTVVQGGFLIGIGVLLDTFLVTDRHGARHGDLGGAGELVAVQAEHAAPGDRRHRQRPGRRSNVTVDDRRRIAGRQEWECGDWSQSVTALVTVGATGCFGSGIAAADDTKPAGRRTTAHRATHRRMGTPGKGTRSAARTFSAFRTTSTSSAPVPNGSRTGSADRRLSRGPGAGSHPGAIVSRHQHGSKTTFRARYRRPKRRRVGRRGSAATSIGAIREGGPGTAIGLSEGAMVLNDVQAQLANDPNAPPPDQLSFAIYGDPVGKHAFGESFLTQMFPVGSVVPSLDYRMPAPVESQYDTYEFVSAYDSIADWPDRPDNWMSLANAVVGLATGHTAVAFTNPSNVPAQNIRTTVNSKGAKTTTYMIPEQHLPLVLPFKYLGVDEGTLNKLDGVLQADGGCGIFTKRRSTDRSDHSGSGARLRPGGRHRARHAGAPSAAPPTRCRSCWPASSTCCNQRAADNDCQPTKSRRLTTDVIVTLSPQSTVLSMLHGRASLRPNDVAFTFTDYEKDWAGVPESVTWSQLSRRTFNVARELRLHGSVGDRAVILAPQGLDYIVAFLGAMQAGLIAVPLPLPHRGSTHERVERGLRRHVALGRSHNVGGRARCRRLRRSIAHGRCSQDRRSRLAESGCRRRTGRRDRADVPDTAYLQYSSGSTRTPTGVMMSHRNLR